MQFIAGSSRAHPDCLKIRGILAMVIFNKCRRACLLARYINSRYVEGLVPESRLKLRSGPGVGIPRFLSIKMIRF